MPVGVSCVLEFLGEFVLKCQLSKLRIFIS